MEPKDMDIHFKDGIFTCKYCKGTKKIKWPLPFSEIDILAKEGDKFYKDHTPCKLKFMIKKTQSN